MTLGDLELTSAKTPTFQPRLAIIGLTWLAIFSSRGLHYELTKLHVTYSAHRASLDFGLLGRCSNLPTSDMLPGCDVSFLQRWMSSTDESYLTIILV